MFDTKEILTIGISSSALFDLADSDQVFRHQGVRAYEDYQKSNREVPLKKGAAYTFVERILSLNEIAPYAEQPLVEVFILSSNSPMTGIRVQNSISQYGLPITRGIYTEGKSPYRYMNSFDMELFLSSNAEDVYRAVSNDLPAGQFVENPDFQYDNSKQVRIAFDFDGIIADDESEKVFAEANLDGFLNHELRNRFKPMNPGPLKNLLSRLNHIQRIEREMFDKDNKYEIRLEISLVTARNAPANQRALFTLESWGLSINNAFFLGGIDKDKVLKELKPHIFFDDQEKNLTNSKYKVPCVHVPFGFRNQIKK